MHVLYNMETMVVFNTLTQTNAHSLSTPWTPNSTMRCLLPSLCFLFYSFLPLSSFQFNCLSTTICVSTIHAYRVHMYARVVLQFSYLVVCVCTGAVGIQIKCSKQKMSGSKTQLKSKNSAIDISMIVRLCTNGPYFFILSISPKR